MKTQHSQVQELIEKIVSYVHPVSIWLFGSFLEEHVTEDSDIDLLIVMPEGVHKRKTAQLLYKNIKNIGRPFDLIVTTEKELQKHKENIGLIYKKVLDQGEKVYALSS